MKGLATPTIFLEGTKGCGGGWPQPCSTGLQSFITHAPAPSARVPPLRRPRAPLGVGPPGGVCAGAPRPSPTDPSALERPVPRRVLPPLPSRTNGSSRHDYRARSSNETKGTQITFPHFKSLGSALGLSRTDTAPSGGCGSRYLDELSLSEH